MEIKLYTKQTTIPQQQYPHVTKRIVWYLTNKWRKGGIDVGLAKVEYFGFLIRYTDYPEMRI